MAKIKTWVWWLTHPRVNSDHIIGQLKYRLWTLPRAAYQRARYGWAEWDIHGGFQGSVVPAIGHQLVYFADNCQAYPGESNGYTEQEWRDALRANGEALIDFGEEEYRIPKIVSDYLFNNRTDYSAEMPEDVQAVWDNYNEEETARFLKARQAMHWVADNMANLWD
jgi:hypothetical protein